MYRIILLFLALFSLGCSTGRIATTANTKPNETIVFGKLTLDSSRPLASEKIVLHFNERLWGKHTVWLDESGYFYMKLPLGNHFLSLLEYRDNIGFYKNLPPNYISVNLTEPEKVYYIGDIYLTWTPVELADMRQNKGVVGAIAEAEKKGEYVPASVESSQQTVNFFKQKFIDNQKEIVTELVTIE